MELTTPMGIALVVIGLIVAFKAVKTVVKVLMLLVIAAGVYLMVNGQTLSDINPFG